MRRAAGLEGDLEKKKKSCHGKLPPPTGKKKIVSFAW